MYANQEVGSGYFRDRVVVPDQSQSQSQSLESADAVGKKCKLITNSFGINMQPSGVIYHYAVSMVPAAQSLKEEEWVMQSIWDFLSKAFNGVFVVRTPGHIFSPNHSQAKSHMQTSTPANDKAGYAAHEVHIHLHEAITAEQVKKGKIGLAGVVFQHVVKKLAGKLMYQKVGRRYYDCSNTNDKEKLMVFSSFYAKLQTLNSCGPVLLIDTLHRATHKTNILAYIQQCLDGAPDLAIKLQDPEVQAEWRRRCIGATVVTLYNNRIYRIKYVDFEKTPLSTYSHYKREEKAHSDISYHHYYEAYYSKTITEARQPLLAAFPEKDSEKVFLVPELCALTGFNDDMRKDKNLMSEALKQTKVAPPDRYKAILDLKEQMSKSGSKPEDSHPQSAAVNQLMQKWKLSLTKEPLQVDARIHPPLEVSFGQKQYTIEDGNFQKWMRNGLQCPTKLDEWLFIYPESDVPVLEIWLRSLRDIAQVAFAMKMGDPIRVICSNQREEIVTMLQKKLTPKTQMVLLLTPQKDAKKVYELFKQTTISTLPCVTQVVKSETIRKRQSIAAVLSRIVLQINAKFCGPLWHIELEGPDTAPAMKAPTMVIGLDVFKSCERDPVEYYIGFAASLDTHCADYFSMSSRLDKDDVHGSMAVKIQEFMRDAIAKFTRLNSKMLPEHFIVYRASASEDQWTTIRQTEIHAIQLFVSSLNNLDLFGGGNTYEPKLTFVAISKHVRMRFFMNGPEGTVKNPEPGTIIDCELTSRPDMTSFYLVNQSAGKGTANPTHYTVLYDTAGMGPAALQNLTYRLSYLYFNFTGSVKMPAPAQYAKKIAHFIGTAVRDEPHKRLLCSFFYL